MIVQQYGVFRMAPGDFVMAHRDIHFYLYGITETFQRSFIDTWYLHALVGRAQSAPPPSLPLTDPQCRGTFLSLSWFAACTTQQRIQPSDAGTIRSPQA